MYLYKIGYGTYEENSYVELSHENKFTEEELTEMIASAIASLIVHIEPDENGQYYAHQFKFDEFFNGIYRFDSKERKDIVEWLIEVKGFKRIEYDVTWQGFGWCSVLDKGDWASSRKKNDEVSQITDHLNKFGIKNEDYPTGDGK